MAKERTNFLKKINLSDRQKRIAGNTLFPLIALAIFLLVWFAVAKIEDLPQLMPEPKVVFAEFFVLLGDSVTWTNVGFSVIRTVLSFALSFVCALVLAVLGGLVAPLHKTISPIISILRAVPTMAVILLMMIWVDYQRAPIIVGFLIAFPILYSAFYSAIVSVDKDLVEMTKFYEVSPMLRVRSLYLPEIAVTVFDTSSTTISLCFKVVVASEILAQTRDSIGLSMQGANLYLDIALLLAWTMIAIVFSFVLEGAVNAIKWIWRRHR